MALNQGFEWANQNDSIPFWLLNVWLPDASPSKKNKPTKMMTSLWEMFWKSIFAIWELSWHIPLTRCEPANIIALGLNQLLWTVHIHLCKVLIRVPLVVRECGKSNEHECDVRGWWTKRAYTFGSNLSQIRLKNSNSVRDESQRWSALNRSALSKQLTLLSSELTMSITISKIICTVYCWDSMKLPKISKPEITR
jgi:hypothetical protein